METALSVWLATGQETWACLGISNIARAPLPDGAAVIIARDGEPWWLETQELDALAAEEQAERYQGDAWDELIEVFS